MPQHKGAPACLSSYLLDTTLAVIAAGTAAT